MELTITGPWIPGDDKDLVGHWSSAYFEDAPGHRVEYSGSDSFESEIRRASQTGALSEHGGSFRKPGPSSPTSPRRAMSAPLPRRRAWIRENYAARDLLGRAGTSYNEQAGRRWRLKRIFLQGRRWKSARLVFSAGLRGTGLRDPDLDGKN